MAKKKKKKDKKNKKFGSLLEFNRKLSENIDIIKVKKNGKSISLEKAVNESVEKVQATQFDSIIEVGAEEALVGKTSKKYSVETYYSASMYKVFEKAMASAGKGKETLVLTFDAEDADKIFHPGFYDVINTIYSKTNLKLIFDNLQKPLKRLTRWCEAESDEEYDMFVMMVPDVVLFTGNIVNDGDSDALFFDIVFQFVKSRKDLEKLARKAKAEEFIKFVTKCSAEVLKKLGINSSIFDVNPVYDWDFYMVADTIKKTITEDEQLLKMINEISFANTVSTNYAILSRICFEIFNK